MRLSAIARELDLDEPEAVGEVEGGALILMHSESPGEAGERRPRRVVRETWRQTDREERGMCRTGCRKIRRRRVKEIEE